MRKILFSIIALFVCLSLNAQTNEEHISFLGRPIAGSAEVFTDFLQEKGFTKKSEFESSYTFLGKFANEIVELKLLASPRTKTICKVIVFFPQKDTWSDLKEDYFKKKRLYKSKYLLDTDFEFFSSPFEDGDGYEMRAVAAGKCKYVSFFNEHGGHITVEICPLRQVKVTYEDSVNIKVAQEELEHNAYEDI